MTTDKRYNWLRSGAYNMVLYMQSLIFGFGSFYLLVRLIGKDSYGIWVLFVATTTIFDSARNGLVQNALIKHLSASPDEEHKQIISASIFLNALFILLSVLVNFATAGFFARLWHYPGLVPMFYTFSLVYLAQGCLSQLQWIEQAYLSFAGVLVSGIIRQAGPFLYILYCFLRHTPLSLQTLIYAQLYATLLGAVIEFLFVRGRLRRLLWPSWNRIMDLFHYGKYVFSTSVSVVLIGTINQMMLGTILSPAAAGAFNVISRITNLAEIPVNAMSSIVFPQSARRLAVQGQGAGKYLYERSVGVILALSIPPLLVLALFPNWVIRIIAGSKFMDVAGLLPLIALFCLFTPFLRLFGTILDSSGRPKVNFIIVLSIAITESISTFFFIRQFGFIGAIYASLLSAILFFGIIQIILNKLFHVNFINAFIYAARFYPEMAKTYLKPRLTGK